MMARALEANGVATVYIVGRRMEALKAAVKHSVRQSGAGYQHNQTPVTTPEDLTLRN